MGELVRAADLTWREYSEEVAQRIVVLPLGAVDPHGLHLPLATDSLIASRLATLLTERVDGLLLPTIPFGPRTDPVRAGGSFPGFIGTRLSTAIRLIADILESVARDGGRRFLLVNAHMSNVPAALEALSDHVQAFPDGVGMVASWWDGVTEETRDRLAEQHKVPRDVDHHAAFVETSLLMHVSGGTYQPRTIVDGERESTIRHLVLPVPVRAQTASGVVLTAAKASAAVGEVVLSEAVAVLGDAALRDLV